MILKQHSCTAPADPRSDLYYAIHSSKNYRCQERGTFPLVLLFTRGRTLINQPNEAQTLRCIVSSIGLWDRKLSCAAATLQTDSSVSALSDKTIN